MLLARGGLPGLGVGPFPLALGGKALLLFTCVRLSCRGARLSGPDRLPGADANAHDQRKQNHGTGCEDQLVSLPRLLQLVGRARRSGEDGFVIEVSLDVTREAVG